MAYHSQEDLVARFTSERIAEIYSVQAADGSTTGSVNTSAIDAAIADTDAIINSILGTVFTTPLDPIDPLIVTLACHINPWIGIQRRPEWLTNSRYKPFEDLHDKALKTLHEIRKGERIISSNHVAANVGGEVLSDNPDDATPFYFTKSRTDDDVGGFGSLI